MSFEGKISDLGVSYDCIFTNFKRSVFPSKNPHQLHLIELYESLSEAIEKERKKKRSLDVQYITQVWNGSTRIEPSCVNPQTHPTTTPASFPSG
jgi:hypothetical protein